MKIIIYILVLFSSIFLGETAKAQSVEYAIKASFIEKIARFTEWKSDPKGDCFIICILGQSPFNGELENLSKKIRIKGKPLKITYESNFKNIKDCNLVFICQSEKSKLPEITNYLNESNILTISDSPGFCRKGVQVNFYIDQSETIKYEMNPTAINAAGLMVDMQLLSMGKIISKN